MEKNRTAATDMLNNNKSRMLALAKDAFEL